MSVTLQKDMDEDAELYVSTTSQIISYGEALTVPVVLEMRTPWAMQKQSAKSAKMSSSWKTTAA
jgi:hypothetical protein